MNELRKYLDIINEDVKEVRNFSFYFTGDYGDENFYVKPPNPDSNTVQRAAMSIDADGAYSGSHEMDEEDLEMFGIIPSQHEYFEPYLYDSGT